MGAALGSEEQEETPLPTQTAPSEHALDDAPPPPTHPGLLELQLRGVAAVEARLSGGVRGVALSALEPTAGGSTRDGVLSPVDCCVLSLGMPPPRARQPEPEPERQRQPQQPPPPQTGGAADGPPSDPDEMRVWLQAQMAATNAAEPEPEPEPEPETLPEAVPPAGPPSVVDGWEKLYDSHQAGTALHTFARGIGGYDGPSLLVLRVRPQCSGGPTGGSAAAKAGVIGAYVDTPWRVGEKFFGGNRSFLFGMAERGQPEARETCVALSPLPLTSPCNTDEFSCSGDREHCRMFPATSADKTAPPNIGYLCTEPRRGGPERGVGFGGSRPGKATCR